MQSDGASRAVVRWSLGLVLLAGAALALLLLHPGRAGAAELPTLPSEVVAVVDATAPGVLPPDVVETGDAVLDGAVGTVVDATEPLVSPVLAPVDPGSLPVVGELLDPLPLPTPVPLPVPLPDLPGTGPTAPGTPSGGGTAAAATSLLRSEPAPASEPVTRMPLRLADPGDIGAEAAVESALPTGGGPIDAAVDLVAPLGTLAGTPGGGAGPGLLLLAVLGALAWACARGPGQRLPTLLAPPARGVVIAFERPG